VIRSARRLCAYVPVVASIGAFALGAHAQGDLNVTVEPPLVERVEFDRRRPPRGMPRTVDADRGVCRNVFEIEANIVSSIETLSPTAVRVYPEHFEITTRLSVTIYTVQGASLKLRAHEEGHRTIGEYYYGNADSAAREAARSLAGQVFEASGVDRRAAAHAAGELMLAALKAEFMQRTHARSVAANARYDAITDHGRKATLESVAVAAALATDP
jgi:hypothetical protein